MGNHILNSFEIKNFRAFRQLCIQRLGHVNLIVGKNNVGKTCLLEALRLYAHRGDPAIIWEILESRDEGESLASRDASEVERSPSLRYLFHGRPDIVEIAEAIRIGPCNNGNEMLVIGLGWYATQVDEQGIRKLEELQPVEYSTVENPELRLTVQIGNQSKTTHRLDSDLRRRSPRVVTLQGINNIFIEAGGLNKTQIGNLWDNIAISDSEGDVLAALRIIAPTVERLSIIGEQEARVGMTRRLERIPIVRIEGSRTPIPLKSLGEGMNRMLGLALALVNAAEGILLIDEIESGLHYSVQFDMWRLIFQLASRLNVQVFAATHSWDCIEAFQRAAQEHPAEGLLIRLGRKKNDIVATLFDEQELAIATKADIEVR